MDDLKREEATTWGGVAQRALILFFPCLLATALARQGFFYALFFAWLEVKGVTLNFFDDVFLLYLALETAQSILEGLSLLESDFGQRPTPPNSSHLDRIVIARFFGQVKRYVRVLHK